MDKKQILKKAFKDSLPVLAGYVVLGTGFGIVLETKGFGVLWAFIMSALIYAGSMQYVAINLLSGGATLISAALTTLMVNARHLFYGISMVDKYKGSGKKKPYLIFALTDETYSIVCSDSEGINDNSRHSYYFWLSLFNQCYWVTGSVLGGVLGSVITFNTKGIDFSLTALFVTVFVEQWLSTKDHSSAIIGVVSSVLCLVIFGAESFLIPAMILITVSLTAFRFIKSKIRRNKKDA